MLVNHIVFRAVARIGPMVTVSARGFGSNAARHGGCKPKVPPLTTLHPPLLQPSDFRSLSSLLKPKIGQQMQERTNISPVHYKYHDGRYIPFPNDAHGFFYFHPGPSYAPIAGEVRFRIVHSGDPAHFNRGHDLLDTSQRLPWSIPLATVLYYKTYKAFAHLLIDATIPGLHATGVLERFARNDLQNAGMDASIMHSLGQPLFSGVSRPFIHFRIARSDGLSKLHTFRVLPTRKTQSHLSSFTPYTGSILYTLEHGRGEGPSHCQIRVLDIVEPICLVDPDYDGPLPIRGELLQRVSGDVRKIFNPDVFSLPSLLTQS